jgi:hypothetical protein
MSRWIVVLGSLIVGSLFAGAASADPCSDATACCNAAMDAMGQPRSACANVANAGAAQCAQIQASFARTIAAMHKPVPQVCIATPSGGGGDGTGSAGTGSGGAGSGAGSAAPPGAGPRDQPPHPLPAENDKPAASPDNKISCIIERLTGKRVMLTGSVENLQVKCTGIVDDSSVLKPVPQRSASGGVVKVKWTAATTVGKLSVILLDRATYEAPDKVTGSANENVIRARVTVDGPGKLHESVDAVRTMHAINKQLELTVTGHLKTHCGAKGGGSVTAEFEVECQQKIDLEIGADFNVSSAKPRSCTAAAWKAMRMCTSAGTASVPQAKWSLTSAVGKVDPDSAVMELKIEGDRVGWPDIQWPQKIDRAHTNSLFPRPLSIGPDDNVMRVFGSMTDNATMGNQTIFELDAR